MAFKVIHFISSLSIGGKERQLSTIYKYNEKHKHEFKILYINERYPNYINEFAISATDLIKINATDFWGRVTDTYKIIKQEKPSIVYAWGTLEVMISMIIKPFIGFTFINGSIRHGILSRKFSHYFRMLLLQASVNVVANSKAGLRANYLRKGHIMYNGIEDKFFDIHINSPDVAELKKNLQTPVFISVANLVPYKDYYTVFQALTAIKQKEYSFSYLIIGDGPMKNEIISRIESHGLQNQIILLGYINNVEEYLAIADIFIHSSKGEGCSNAILEAMAAGLPVVATNVGGTPEIVDQTHGILFDYKKTEELIHAIEFLFSDASIIKKMGIKARQKAKSICSVNALMKRYYKITDEILSRQHRYDFK